jgi:hypothetical protein
MAFYSVITWFDQLVNAMGVGDIIFSAFCLSGVIFIFLMPFRGTFGFGGLGDSYYTANVIHRETRSSRSKNVRKSFSVDDVGTSSSYSGVSYYD